GLLPEPTGLDHGPLSVVRQRGRDLDRAVAVAVTGLLPDRAEDTRRVSDVADRQDLEDVPARRALGCPLLEEVVVVLAALDRLLEDGGVGGQALEPVVVDEPLQLTAGDEVPPHVVEPHALTLLAQRLERIHDCSLPSRLTRRLSGE